MLIVFAVSRTLRASRSYAEHISLGQINPVRVDISTTLSEDKIKLFTITAYDTLPHNCIFNREESPMHLGSNKYSFIPEARGRYEFGPVTCFVQSRLLNLAEAKRSLHPDSLCRVYPTFHQLDKLEIQATHNTMQGQKRLRRAGNSTDFDQIRSYVPGDDVRRINWKATARASAVMVNHYTDERSRPIIPVICAGPSMLVATDGITLLDRAVSAAVALAASAIRHYDEAGLITLTHKGVDTYIKPERAHTTISKILKYTYDFGLPPTPSEMPYVDDPDVLPDDIDKAALLAIFDRMDACVADANIDALAEWTRKRLNRRSLLVLFANFENIETAKQSINALKDISRRHTLLVVLFINEGVDTTAHAPYLEKDKVSNKLSELRFRSMCADYLEQQQKLATLLRQSHINVMLTRPAQLSTAVLKTYLDLKNIGVV